MLFSFIPFGKDIKFIVLNMHSVILKPDYKTERISTLFHTIKNKTIECMPSIYHFFPSINRLCVYILLTHLMTCFNFKEFPVQY